MYSTMKQQLRDRLDQIRADGTYKHERQITSDQQARIQASGKEVLNFCANNYLGLANRPELIQAAKDAMDHRGFGMASVRFICGTTDEHKRLEALVSDWLGTEDTILFSSCFDANGGVFESLFGPEDAIISDALNHASIIDGVRLCKAQRYRYANADMDDLRAQLEAAKGARQRVIVTDGVFSMDGYYAPLEQICDLADEYHALVMVDDSHAVGFVGEAGRGTPARAGVADRVDIWTGTFGKALGGASGGYVSGRAEIIEVMRQVARPYLFSNTLAPAIVGATEKAIEIARGAEGDALRDKVEHNAALFRRLMAEASFDLLPGEHAIIPVMFGDAALAGRIADAMLDLGVYVIAFSYPVVPKGKARIRVQLSADHSDEDIQTVVEAFITARDQVTAD